MTKYTQELKALLRDIGNAKQRIPKMVKYLIKDEGYEPMEARQKILEDLSGELSERYIIDCLPRECKDVKRGQLISAGSEIPQKEKRALVVDTFGTTETIPSWHKRPTEEFEQAQENLSHPLREPINKPTRIERDWLKTFEDRLYHLQACIQPNIREDPFDEAIAHEIIANRDKESAKETLETIDRMIESLQHIKRLVTKSLP